MSINAFLVKNTRSYELPPPPPPVAKASRKRLYIAAGVAAIVVVVTAFILTRFLLGAGAMMPLTLNYKEGESMTYAIIMSMPNPITGQQINQTAVMYMEVLDFDGENYTIRYRIDQESFTVKVNKYGYVVEGLSQEIQQFYTAILANAPSVPGLGSGFPKPMAAVGEEIQFQLTLNISDVYITGTVNLRFSELTTKTLLILVNSRFSKLIFQSPTFRSHFRVLG